MDEDSLRLSLRDLPLAEIRYFSTIDSTNRYALEWVEQGAPDQSLVVADEQTAGRGRMGRRWFTPANSALAFTLILRPTAEETQNLSLFPLWSSLSLCRALRKNYGLVAQVKWPNDVLLFGQKTAGILAEAVWSGEIAEGLVIGMGVNVQRTSVPPAGEVLFPATCLEAHIERPVLREELLRDIVREFIAIRKDADKTGLLNEYISNLAFRGEMVRIVRPEPESALEGRLLGITLQGDLRLETLDGTEHAIHAGDVHLRAIHQVINT